MKLRARIVIGSALAIGAGVACSEILGLQDRTLRDGGATDAIANDAATEAAPSCNDAGWCACHPHDFCDDFDSYQSVQELKKNWKSSAYPSTVSVGGALSLDSVTSTPPSSPNALLARTGIPNLLGDKLAAAAAITQLDGTMLHGGGKPIIGLALEISMRVDEISPDGGAPLLDSGVYMTDAIIAIANPKTNDGVGVAFSEADGYIGYALNILGGGSIAQGSPFLHYKPAQPLAIFQHMRIVVAERKSIQVSDLTCKQGPVIAQPDASAPDAAGPPGPETMVVAVFPLTNASATATCEILTSDLAFSDWIAQPFVIVGSTQTGYGTFQIAYDDVTVDFLTE